MKEDSEDMWRIIIAPLVGLVIGYITNDLAIRMLFHPYKPIYIGKWKIPFTPGLIPAQRERIAKSLGAAVGTHLLNAETIREEILSEETMQKLRNAIENRLQDIFSGERSVREMLSAYVPEEEIEETAQKLQAGGTEYLMDRLREANLAEQIAAHVTDSVRNKVRQTPIGALFGDRIINSLSPMIRSNIDEMIEKKGPQIISEQIGRMEKDLLDTPTGEMLQKHRDVIPSIADGVLSVYRNVIENRLDDIIRAAGIDGIVERKIATFEPAELENLIFGIMKKELRAIVYLGALLGFFMGFINLLFR